MENMNKYHFVGFVLLMVLFFSPDVSSEENFTISLNPGWSSQVDGECETITTHNGTYEECAKVLQFETKLSGYNDSGSPSEWAIDGDMHAFTGDRNVMYTDVYSVPGAPLGSSFTFSLNGANFSDNTTYSFSYSLRTSKVYSSIDHRPYWRNEPNSNAFHTNLGYDYLRVRITPNLILDTSSVLFSGNSSQELNFNLTGQIGSTENGPFDTNILLNSTNSPLWGPQTVYLNDCTRMYAEVILTKNASTDSEEILAHYVSTDFTPEEYSRNLCSLSTSTDYSMYDAGFGYGDELIIVAFIVLVFGSAIIYAQAKLTSWYFTGSYSSKFTQYLALIVIVSLFFVLVFFPPVFCIAIVILFAQIVAYSTTDHYEKLADSEGRDDTKKSMAGIFRALLIVIGLIFVFIGSSTAMFGTLMEASSSFTVSIICFMLFFYLGRKDKSKVDDKPEEPGDSEGDLVDTKKSMAEYFRAFLLLTGIIFIFFGLNVLMTCSLSMPPQCGTLMEASPCFSVSIICFILFFYLGRKEKSKIDNKLEISEEDQPKPK